MLKTVVTPSPGFVSIAVRDAERSAGFYERYLGATRDTFDFGPDSVTIIHGLGTGALRDAVRPRGALSSARRPDLPAPSPDTTSIQLWWRASDAQALFEQVVADGVPVLAEPFDGPFGRTFAMADPDGYRITVYEKDQPLFWPPRRG